MSSYPASPAGRPGWTHASLGDIARQLRGALHVDEHGIVITTSTFTEAAVAEAGASGEPPIALVDGPKLVDLLIEQGIGVQKRPLSLWKLDSESLDLPWRSRRSWRIASFP